MSIRSIKAHAAQHWNTIGSLDGRVYVAVLATGILTAACALVMSVVQRMSPVALVSACACVVWLTVLLILCLRRREPVPWMRTASVCVLNFVLFPIAFFAFGGLDSGLTLFYLLGLFNAAVLLRGRTRGIVFFISFFEMLATLHLDRVCPSLAMPITEAQRYHNIKLSLLLAGLSLVSLTGIILREYEAERARNLELMERLRSMSTRDALSGLYNRRELSRRLDLVYKKPQERSLRDDHLKREGCYIAMFDVDNFKHLNDTYGHQFGDTVLSTVAQKLSEAMTPKTAEFAARYGGEEFVCLMYADSMDDAFRRTDAMRQSVASLAWRDVPGLTVTVSGGLISCEAYDQLKRAMLDVDKMLYQAKRSGKNQIATELKEEKPPEF
ncbi:MAG: GGDEF domain-containing protein [Ruminococcaceae bacterium]|nr:GGDEF domain-containing protein [Oscillospiraceae bacterium]